MSYFQSFRVETNVYISTRYVSCLHSTLVRKESHVIYEAKLIKSLSPARSHDWAPVCKHCYSQGVFMGTSCLIIIRQMRIWEDLSPGRIWALSPGSFTRDAAVSTPKERSDLHLMQPEPGREGAQRACAPLCWSPRGASPNTAPFYPSAVEGQAATMSPFAPGACLAPWLMQGHSSHLVNVSWQGQVLFGTVRVLLRSFLWCTHCSVDRGHWSGSRWHQPLPWLPTCLLPACAVQHFSQQDCSSCSLALGPKPASPLGTGFRNETGRNFPL